MKMWFLLQRTMLIRSMHEAGLHPIAAVALIPVLLYLLLFVTWEQVPYPETVFSMLSLVVLLKPTNRKRNEFIQAVFGKPIHSRIRLLEQLLLAAPITACLIIKQAWVWAILLPPLSASMAYLRTDPGRGLVLPTPFGRFPYEGPVGFRKSIHWIVLSTLVLVAGVLSGNHALFPASMLILVLSTSSFYGDPDESTYVWIFNTKPRIFLLKKWGASCLFTAVLVIPVLVVATIFDHTWLPILGGILLFGLCLNALIIAGRYSSFPDKLSFANGLIMVFSVIFLPLLPVVILWLIHRSERRLSTLLV